MKILNKLWLYLFIFIFVFSVSIVICLFYIFPNKIHKIRILWAKFQLFLLGAKVEIRGEINENTQMFIMNHQSLLDIVLLEAISKKDISWIGKKEIGDMFFFGQVMKKPKMILIDRASARDFLVRVVKEAEQRVKENRILSIFPDGTRGGEIKTIKPFKRGAEILAKKLNLKVQPILIVGAKNALDSTSLHIKRNQKIIIKFFDIVSLDDENWLENTRIAMQKELDEILKQNEDCF